MNSHFDKFMLGDMHCNSDRLGAEKRNTRTGKCLQIYCVHNSKSDGPNNLVILFVCFVLAAAWGKRVVRRCGGKKKSPPLFP